ncbi:hypothetical protein [Methylobacterium sp. ARG-1]|uniref:hypothetical protein n=1 Tax=Methylobacterium sp. ARG-1 TaxID=1692501 RepID=UPI000680E9A4|nr:hypothetical protein [Methylobacterium sp. ARG-1]KNY21076.1 hypothetical protein AKJ13_18930 [Methylobacterium sp. ARG-1]
MPLIATLTDLERTVLGPFQAKLHPDHLSRLLTQARNIGMSAQADRRTRRRPRQRFKTTDREWDGVREGHHDAGAILYFSLHPGGPSFAADEYGECYAEAVQALRVLYLDDPDRADAALKAVEAQGFADLP